MRYDDNTLFTALYPSVYWLVGWLVGMKLAFIIAFWNVSERAFTENVMTNMAIIIPPSL